MATCLTCGRQFASALQLGAHARTAACEVNDEGDALADVTAAVITAAQPAALHELTRRKCGEWGRIRNVDIPPREMVGTPRDYVQVSLLLLLSFCCKCIIFTCCMTVAEVLAGARTCGTPKLCPKFLESFQIFAKLHEHG